LGDLRLAERSLGEQLLECAEDRCATCVALLRWGGRRFGAQGLDAPILPIGDET
jgi:hypothetical protein